MTSDKLEYTLKRSRRKTLAIRVERDGKITVLAPLRASASLIAEAVEKNREWINKKRALLAEVTAKYDRTPITEEELCRLLAEAKEYIPKRVSFLADEFKVSIGKVSVKAMRSKWGSCSGKRNISINCLLMLAPREVLDYIIIHELCHVTHMDHSKSFYALVDQRCDFRKSSEKWLKTEGSAIIDRAKRGAFS